MDVDDPLKPLDKIFEADRDCFEESIEDRHNKLSSINISGEVPKNVSQLIETAKNLSLYSYYVYRFHQPAELICLISFELALKERARLSDVKVKPDSFMGHINYAIEQKWLDNRDDPDLIEKAVANARRENFIDVARFLEGEASMLEPTTDQVDKQLDDLTYDFNQKEILHSSRRLRNSLAHDNGYLAPTSVSTLFRTVRLINKLFKSEANG
jgi:hypothetical protein